MTVTTVGLSVVFASNLSFHITQYNIMRILHKKIPKIIKSSGFLIYSISLFVSSPFVKGND